MPACSSPCLDVAARLRVASVLLSCWCSRLVLVSRERSRLVRLQKFSSAKNCLVFRRLRRCASNSRAASHGPLCRADRLFRYLSPPLLSPRASTSEFHLLRRVRDCDCKTTATWLWPPTRVSMERAGDRELAIELAIGAMVNVRALIMTALPSISRMLMIMIAIAATSR